MNNTTSSKLLTGTAALVLAAGTILGTIGPASAQWHGHGWGGHGWGWGGAALAAGVVGGAVAVATSPLWAPGYYYDYYPGYAYGPGYGYDDAYGYDNAYGYGYAAGPAVAVAPGPIVAQGYGGGDSVAYCDARFRSYDPASGTYLGFDGMRHPCP